MVFPRNNAQVRASRRRPPLVISSRNTFNRTRGPVVLSGATRTGKNEEEKKEAKHAETSKRPLPADRVHIHKEPWREVVVRARKPTKASTMKRGPGRYARAARNRPSFATVQTGTGYRQLRYIRESPVVYEPADGNESRLVKNSVSSPKNGSRDQKNVRRTATWHDQR